MEIAPRYDGRPVIDVDGDPRTPFLRQHRRLRQVFERLTDEQWRTPSRCEGWTAQDVASHLATVNGFWAASIDAGRKGEPTRFLVGFDPRATPAMLVDAGRSKSPQETLTDFQAASDALTQAVDQTDLDVVAEAPPGHVSVRALLHHALWDSWVHERDVLLPLGETPPHEDDEVLASLRYVAGLSPAFAVTQGRATADRLVLRTTEPTATIVVDVDGDAVRVSDDDAAGDDDGALVLEGAAAELIESLSVRAAASDVPPERQWLTSALADVFR